MRERFKQMLRAAYEEWCKSMLMLPEWDDTDVRRTFLHHANSEITEYQNRKNKYIVDEILSVESE